jgi:hypothetical protein
MKQQTALEWFMYKVDECENTDDFLDAYNEAKEMEKEQIIESWLAGENDGSLEPKAFVEMAEQYYNETYNQK